MSASAEARIANAISLTERLGELVTAENGMFAAKQAAEIASHQDEKTRLTQAYQAEMQALRDNPSWLRAAAPADVDRLKAATRSFQDILDVNRRALLAAKTVTERLFKTIGDEIAKRQRPVQRYDKSATVASSSGAFSAPAASVALDQVI